VGWQREPSTSCSPSRATTRLRRIQRVGCACLAIGRKQLGRSARSSAADTLPLQNPYYWPQTQEQSMSTQQTLVLAFVQGIAQRLPASISAHVIRAEKWKGLDPAGPDPTLLRRLPWPLRERVHACLRETNDAAHILFAVYVGMAISAATRTHARPAADVPAHRWPAGWRARPARAWGSILAARNSGVLHAKVRSRAAFLCSETQRLDRIDCVFGRSARCGARPHKSGRARFTHPAPACGACRRSDARAQGERGAVDVDFPRARRQGIGDQPARPAGSGVRRP